MLLNALCDLIAKTVQMETLGVDRFSCPANKLDLSEEAKDGHLNERVRRMPGQVWP